jgi:hypothetical protein
MIFTLLFFSSTPQNMVLRIAKRKPNPLSKGGVEIIHLFSLIWKIPLK